MSSIKIFKTYSETHISRTDSSWNKISVSTGSSSMSYTHANMYYTVNGQVLTREEADAVTLSAKENLYFNEQKVSKEISRRSVDDVDALVHSSKWRTDSISCTNPKFKIGKIAIYQW